MYLVRWQREARPRIALGIQTQRSAARSQSRRSKIRRQSRQPKGGRAGTFRQQRLHRRRRKGSLYAPGDYAENKISLSPGLEEIEADFAESPGHWKEWVRAIRGGEEAMSNFPHYAVPLTETVLLGNLAIWAATDPDTPGKKIEWDAKNLTSPNSPEVAQVIKPEFHNGYSV